MKSKGPILRWWKSMAALAASLCILAGCSSVAPLPGLIFTHVKYPLTWDLHNTPMPEAMPKDSKIIEIREPISGLGINARLNANAIGEIARANGMQKLYFADQERFSILGIWTYHKVILYGE
jgi:hypothetical protein